MKYKKARTAKVFSYRKGVYQDIFYRDLWNLKIKVNLY